MRRACYAHNDVYRWRDDDQDRMTEMCEGKNGAKFKSTVARGVFDCGRGGWRRAASVALVLGFIAVKGGGEAFVRRTCAKSPKGGRWTGGRRTRCRTLLPDNVGVRPSAAVRSARVGKLQRESYLYCTASVLCAAAAASRPPPAAHASVVVPCVYAPWNERRRRPNRVRSCRITV